MRHLFHLGICLASSVHRALWLAPMGRCKPVPQRKWEDQYRIGYWNYLNGQEELARYMVIVGYIIERENSPDILDLGCGHGRLLPLLPQSSFNSYLGVDFCQEAIARATRLPVAGAKFIQADIETWIPAMPADVIIFNESIYYFRRPLRVLERYCHHLKQDGRIVISMYKAAGHWTIWRKIARLLDPVHTVRLSHKGGPTWQIGLFAARRLRPQGA